ncbi:MAG: hypothetical protein K2X77_17045 [Candidatus Obscuribacterales bacterium]|jgi:hypothetical protein|nr:hypothetical protein [Candidatus Obscuribacterales bacterium]
MPTSRCSLLSLFCFVFAQSAFAQQTVFVDYVGEPREARLLEVKGEQIKVEFRNALTGEWDGQDIRWKPKSDLHMTQPENYNPNGYGNVNGALNRQNAGGMMPGPGGNFVPNPGGAFPGANFVPNPGGAFPGANAIPGGAPGMPNFAPNMPAVAPNIQQLRDMLPATAPDRKTLNIPADLNQIPPGKTPGGWITIEEHIRRQNGGAVPDLRNLPPEVIEQLRQPNGPANPANPQPQQAQPQQAQPQQPQPQQAQQAQQPGEPFRPADPGFKAWLNKEKIDPKNVIPQFDGPPLSENDIIGYLRDALGDRPQNVPENGPREKIYENLLNMIKNRGTTFKGLDIGSDFVNNLFHYQPPQSVKEAAENNFGAPKPTEWYFGNWNMNKHDFGNMLAGGRAGALTINQDRTYSFEGKQGTWVPATTQDLMKLDKGATGMVLHNFRDGKDWVVYKDDRMPGTDNIRISDIDFPQTLMVGGRQ